MGTSKSVIIVAGGSGKRMGSEVPKQFMLLKNKPVLFYSLEAFHSFDPNIHIVLVLPKSNFDLWKSLCKGFNFTIKHTLVEGGKTRFNSVKNGLTEINNSDLVAIHDGVRPLIDQETIKHLFEEAEKHGNAVPFVPINESTRMTQEDGSRIIDRSKLCIIQTPQIFKRGDLQKAYQQEYQEIFTDDASVVENTGEKIYLSNGHPKNIKITRPLDFKIAETLLDD